MRHSPRVKIFGMNHANVLIDQVWRHSTEIFFDILNFLHPFWGTHQFDLFCTSTIFIYSTFSVLRPLYFDLSTSTALLRPLYFDLFTSTRLLRPLYFDIFSNLDFLLVETYRSKYSFGRSKGVEVQKRSKIWKWSKYRKGPIDAYPLFCLKFCTWTLN